MPYRLDLSQPLEDETRRIALEQIARARRRLSLQLSAMPLGMRLAAESPKALGKRFEHYRWALPG
ncbi:hypothetical protein [Salinicola endophyticus]|uniref:Uncharacterized protein n=1 Tax=Salinicola endophyticus TaxID=1949083 RepID=A0AB74U3L8_9GAMM